MSLRPSGGGLQQPQEVDWERIDKSKFFVIGIGAFSGVTTVLYPLTVIKTNQQLAHGVAQTTAQTTSMIWKTRGLAGFYRGYATVVFGTIPARVVYMTTLEVTKSTAARVGKQFGISDTAIAGSSNFLAGGMSSLMTQLITVPIDVVSQRQMVQSSSSSHATPSTPPVADVKRAASSAAGAAARKTPQAGASGVAGPSQHDAVAAKAAAEPRPSSSSPSGSGSGGGSSGRGLSTAARVAHGVDWHQQRRVHSAVEGRSSAAASAVRPRPPASTLLSAGCRGLPSAADGTPGSAHSAAAMASTSASASTSPRPSAAALPIIRGILREEGVAGLYRGLGASVATFVPSSAVWWGSYGLYQKTIWNALSYLGPVPARTDAAASTQAGASTPDATNAATTSQTKTSDVMAVQAVAACFAGFTSAGLTAPLDLIKTRIQVAKKTEGQAVTFRAVAAEVLREDGWVGMFRAAGPRMLSSALWGTAMVTVYEGLKRVSVKD